MRIDVWSDVVCPWCYLGKRRLETAVSQLAWADEVEVRWRAYQLDPRAPREPGDLRTAIERKYGPGAFDGMVARLTALGRTAGIDYRFDLAQRVGTRDSHRLLAWALATAGWAVQGELKDRLLRAYFTEGANVADPDTLVAAASSVGLDGAEAAGIVASDAYAAEVDVDLAAAAERGITGVPGFVVEDRVLIPGAQEVDTFVAVLERARARGLTG